MNVDQLMRRLRRAPNGATVLLLPARGDADECDMVRGVVSPGQPWVHERQRRADGHVDHFFYPRADEWSEGFNETTDDASLERVVILVADAESLEHTLAELALAGRTISTEDLRAKEVQHYRDMLARGELLSEEAFRKKLGVSKRRLSALVGDGRVFALDVDGHNAFPAFLCDARLNLKRLWKVALILVPAPPVLRLDLLTRQCGALGDEVPLDLLGDDKAFRELLRFARAWAGEFSRTCIDVYDASSPVAPTIAEPLYSCAVEVDPRVPLWTRALKAIHSPGFRFPHEIPPAPATVLIMVERATAGKSGEDLEARLMCELAGRTLRLTVAIARADEPAAAHKLKLAAKHPSVTDLCDAVFSRLAKLT